MRAKEFALGRAITCNAALGKAQIVCGADRSYER
jgi:hypothetical protein